MILTEEEKRQLKELQNHPWFKVLQKIEKEASNILFSKLSVLNLENPDNLKQIKEWQIYQKARNYFLFNVKSHLVEATSYTNEDMLRTVDDYE